MSLLMMTESVVNRLKEFISLIDIVGYLFSGFKEITRSGTPPEIGPNEISKSVVKSGMS